MAQSNTWTSATPTGAANTIQTVGQNTATVSIVPTGTVTAGTIVFESSQDFVNWTPLNMDNQGAAGQATSATATAASSWLVAISAGWVRARLSVAITGGGSVNATVGSSQSGTGGGGGSPAGALLAVNNLSDVANPQTSLANLYQPFAVSCTGTYVLDPTLHAVYDITLTGDCTFSFTNGALGYQMWCRVKGAHTPTFSGVTWLDAITPTYANPSPFMFNWIDGSTIDGQMGSVPVVTLAQIEAFFTADQQILSGTGTNTAELIDLEAALFEYFASDGQIFSGTGAGTGEVIDLSTALNEYFASAGQMRVGTGAGTGELLAKGAAGTVLTVGGADGSGLEWIAALPLVTTFQPSAPAAITNTSPGKMCGVGAVATQPPVYTPVASTAIKVDVALQFLGSAAALGGATLYYGSGTPPANNAAITGTAISPTCGLDFITANLEQIYVAFTVKITGLTVGTAYWLDFAAYTASGSIQPKFMMFTVTECQ